MNTLLISILLSATAWQHPGGLVTNQTLDEIRQKLETQAWAKPVWENQKASVEKWVTVPMAELRKVFPKKRGNVYHNFSCPDCRLRLKYDPFNPTKFECGTCGKTFTPETDAGIYPAGNIYNGTMYDGWICLFYQQAAEIAANLGILGNVDKNEAYLSRSRELLELFAETIKTLPTDHANDGDSTRILTYKREGDNKILADLAVAYELVRDGMSAESRTLVETNALKRMLDDGMLEPIYKYDHNNVYQWYRTIIQVAVCLERDDLIDWCMGYGEFTPEKSPEHRSLQRIAEKNFLPDGAYWELCSGYHLYPMYAFCELAVLTRNISQMDPQRFPVIEYDCTNRDNFGGKTIKNALEWFVSMAMPDRTMPVIGDSMWPRSGMEEYVNTSEIGYRYFDVLAVGDYDSMRTKRSWTGLLYGAPEIKKEKTPFTSSYLSCGWVSLRNEWQDNRLWVGLNATKPGGGHQHADRLGLTLYNHGQLLAFEKGTPYNENVTRELGTFTQSHSTVVLDKQTQKQGEALKGDEIPIVENFFSGEVMKFAEVRADHLYPQTNIYRRSVVVVEDIVIDCFEVRGGECKDWLVQHAGASPEFSMEMTAGAFDPADWLYHGNPQARQGSGEQDWSAKWRVGEVTSRLTMLGAPGTQVYGLETFPIDNAVITKDHPPCQTLCVRRNADGCFLAVWDAYTDTPNLQSVTPVPEQNALMLKTRANTYYIKFGLGKVSFPDSVTLNGDGAVSLLRNQTTCAFSGGTNVEIAIPEGNLRVSLNTPGSAEVDWSGTTIKKSAVCSIHYDTYGGMDHPCDDSQYEITLTGNLGPVSR